MQCALGPCRLCSFIFCVSLSLIPQCSWLDGKHNPVWRVSPRGLSTWLCLTSRCWGLPIQKKKKKKLSPRFCPTRLLATRFYKTYSSLKYQIIQFQIVFFMMVFYDTWKSSQNYSISSPHSSLTLAQPIPCLFYETVSHSHDLWCTGKSHCVFLKAFSWTKLLD